MPQSTSTSSQAEIELLSTQEGYDRWSAVYDTDGNPLVALEEPLVDQLLGDIAGREVIDIGCGTGRHAIRMARAGARVEAIDFSEKMLSRAREKSAEMPIRYQALNVLGGLPFPDNSFDRVICGLVLDHIPTLEEFFGELHRLCRPGGLCVFSVMHPAMMLRGVQARFWDPQTGREVRPASQAHQLCDYVMAAVRTGHGIHHLSEHAISQEFADSFPRGQRYVGWPILLLMALAPRK
jgi:ubiquinone/menaquinone biosynthesis C-methylase UbiE